MVEKDCFAYSHIVFTFDEEYTANKEECLALTELLCKRKICPFYKPKGTEREVKFNAPRNNNTKR